VYGCPIITTGDFNSNYSDTPIQQLVNVGMTSHQSNRGGIDYILYSAGVTGKYFTMINDSDVAGASDHKPIFADVAIAAANPFAPASRLSGGMTSRMEMSERFLGLGFEFTMSATGLVKEADYTADLSNALVKPVSNRQYQLLAMGAIVSNDALVGTNEDKMTLEHLDERTKSVPAEYLIDATSNSATFAVRVTNMPRHCDSLVVYARPYYLYECSGEIIVVYGDIVQDNYIGRIDVNDGALDWQE